MLIGILFYIISSLMFIVGVILKTRTHTLKSAEQLTIQMRIF